MKPRLPGVLDGKEEMWVLSLGQEDPLEESMATHSSILSGKTPRTEESCGLQSMGLCKGVRHDLATKPPLQYTLNQLLFCEIVMQIDYLNEPVKQIIEVEGLPLTITSVYPVGEFVLPVPAV